MAARLKDIARDLGVSVVTVSKVLRNHSDISLETRRRVLKRMKELNYRPNFAARALITGRTHTVGLVVPDLLHPFFAQVAKAISGALREKEYGLFISSCEDDPALESSEVSQLLARGVDALIVASTQWSVQSFRLIEEHNTPYVLVDRSFNGLAANFVGVDDTAGGVLATEHLLEQGCRRIAHIRGPDVSTAVLRLEGYRSALMRAGLVPLPEHIVSVGVSGDDRGDARGFDAANKLLASDPVPDGIFCYNDPVALGVMRAILERGLRIPEDIAIIGFGNLPYADVLRVPLSTIDQNSTAIGESAGRLALTLIEADELRRPEAIIVKPELVVRTSSLRKRSNQ